MTDSIGTVATPTTVARVRRGMRAAGNWWQLLRFSLVGLSGYVVNLTVFHLLVNGAGADHRVGATSAFLVAVSNNFAWNRQWTFRGTTGRVQPQAIRFLTISVVGFAVNLVLLELLVVGGAPKLAAQALAVAMVMPLNFLGNRLWTFRRQA